MKIGIIRSQIMQLVRLEKKLCFNIWEKTRKKKN